MSNSISTLLIHCIVLPTHNNKHHKSVLPVFNLSKSKDVFFFYLLVVIPICFTLLVQTSCWMRTLWRKSPTLGWRERRPSTRLRRWWRRGSWGPVRTWPLRPCGDRSPQNLTCSASEWYASDTHMHEGNPTLFYLLLLSLTEGCWVGKLPAGLDGKLSTILLYFFGNFKDL